jgi:hypothetical protein
MRIYQIDPTKDARWAEFVERHPKASVFHTVAWLQALRRTYGYQTVAFTTSPPKGELKNGLVFCSIKSWLTGCRLVSLPFSDHCEPLCDSAEDLTFLIRYLQTALDHQNWKYVELRPITRNLGEISGEGGFLPSAAYFLHTLDLHPDTNEIFRNLDKDSVQRRIQRAERAGLAVECGISNDLLKEFYALFVLTRGRHLLPPIPYVWFRNLIRYQGDALQIRVAYKDRTPISSVLTLQLKDTLYYKYGCSDARYHNLGATPWLLWRAIAAAKANGATRFDMGRTQEGNAGLLAFKNHWVPQPERLFYWRFPEVSFLDSADGWKLKMAKRVFSHMPGGLLKMTGKLLYRHIG